MNTRSIHRVAGGFAKLIGKVPNRGSAAAEKSGEVIGSSWLENPISFWIGLPALIAWCFGKLQIQVYPEALVGQPRVTCVIHMPDIDRLP
ncbi:MAG: hypothetical protein ACNA8H_16845 [Anaerolineales bacterium]